MFKRLNGWLVLMIITVSFALFTVNGVGAEEEWPEVFYDKAKDILSVDADDASLQILLARIALLSGVEILIDPSIERRISIKIEDRSLEEGLKDIARGLSYAMTYNNGKDNKGKPLLVSMKIVPMGKTPGGLISVFPQQHEAVYRSFLPRPDKRGLEGAPIFDYVMERWEARLDAMPDEKREKFLQMIEERQERQKARYEARQKKKEEHAKRQEERRERKRADEEELKSADPEYYEEMKERQAEMREQERLPE